MACNEPTFSSRGRQGLGVIQPQSGLDYPFVAPSAAVRYLIADFYFEYDDLGLYDPLVPQAVHPLRIKWLYGVGCEENSAIPGMPVPTHAADILIVDSNDVVVFDSTAVDANSAPKIFKQRAWGADYRIYEWIGATAVCRLVAYTTWAPDENETQNYPQHLAPAAAVLDARAVYKMPKRVMSLQVLLDKLRGKEVDFVSGYNIATTTEQDIVTGLRRADQIVFNAEPGAGLGKYSDCADQQPPIVKLNGATGEHVVISAAECLWTQIDTEFNEDETKIKPKIKPSESPILYPRGTGTLVLGSNCSACCDCPDYVNVARYMNCVHDRYSAIGVAAHSVLAQHSSNIERWLEQRDCRIQKPIKAVMTPQRCPTADVIIQYCNLCDSCAEDVNMTIQFSAYPSLGASGYIEQCYSLMSASGVKNAPYIVTGTWPYFFVNFGKVSAGNSANVEFRLRVTPPTPPRTLYMKVSGTFKKDGVQYPIVAGCDPLTDPPVQLTLARPLACTSTGTTITAC